METAGYSDSPSPKAGLGFASVKTRNYLLGMVNLNNKLEVVAGL